MGGGDLNTKKAWHPSTLKNQERVWKAEQAAAEEQRRIAELQRERAQEREREELNKLARQNSDKGGDNRLSWMYDQKPDKKVQQEDYLLGKAIDKNYDNAGKSEQNEIPAVSRRVVGSSMITSGGDTQVDLARKLREDPLLLVKERERAARAALLNNPVQRKKLTELLRKEQEQKNKNKSEKKSKKKKKDLDDLLAAKLQALGGEKGMNIAKLLESSDDTSSDSSSEEEKSKKKKKKKKSKSKKNKHDSDSESPVRNKKSKETMKNQDDSADESPRKQQSKNKKTVPITKPNRDNKYESNGNRSSLKNDGQGYLHHSKSPKKLQRYYDGPSLDRSPSRKEKRYQSPSDSSPDQKERRRRRRSESSPDRKQKRQQKQIESSPDRQKSRRRKPSESSHDRKEKRHQEQIESSPDRKESRGRKHSESSPDRKEKRQQKHVESSPDRKQSRRRKHSVSSPDRKEKRQHKQIESSPDLKESRRRKRSESTPDRKERRQKSPDQKEKYHRKHESSNDRKGEKEKTSETRKRDWEGRKPEHKKPGLSEEEKNARLAEMAAAGAEREIQRGRRVAAQLAENAAADKLVPRHSSRNEARALPDSLESRIHSNRHYIQRDKRHMNEHFARR